MAKLVLLSGDVPVREVPLEKEVFVIGRALESDLALMDHLVSRRHGKLVREADLWRVVDMGSANGVYVNDERITDRVLKHGDRVRIGSSTLEFHGDSPKPPPEARSGLTVVFGPSGAGEEDTGLSVVKKVSDLKPEYTISTSTPQGGVLGMFRDRERRVGAREGLHFFILFQLAQAVNLATSLEELLERAMDMLCEALNAGRGILLLLDSKSGELVPKVAKDRRRQRSGYLNTTDEVIRIPHTIVDRVIKERVSVLTRDALVDPRFQAGRSVAQMQIRSAICVPLWEGEDVMGILYVDNLQMAGAFTEEDRDLVTAVGHQLAIAIKRQEMQEKLKREAVIRANLERYHSPDVVEMILRAEAEVGLDVQHAEVTVLFSDIQGFSKLAERLTASKVAELLNGYFELMTGIIFKHQGSVNKYIGDAIMAIFGAPIHYPDHALRASRAALEMVESLGPFMATKPADQRFDIRIGLNTGEVVAGNMGAARRLEYTVLGDAVNTASRLEGMAPPNGVLIGPLTEQRTRGFVRTDAMGLVKPKGMEKEIAVFRLKGLVVQGATPSGLVRVPTNP